MAFRRTNPLRSKILPHSRHVLLLQRSILQHASLPPFNPPRYGIHSSPQPTALRAP